MLTGLPAADQPGVPLWLFSNIKYKYFFGRCRPTFLSPYNCIPLGFCIFPRGIVVLMFRFVICVFAIMYAVRVKVVWAQEETGKLQEGLDEWEFGRGISSSNPVMFGLTTGAMRLLRLGSCTPAVFFGRIDKRDNLLFFVCSLDIYAPPRLVPCYCCPFVHVASSQVMFPRLAQNRYYLARLAQDSSDCIYTTASWGCPGC